MDNRGSVHYSDFRLPFLNRAQSKAIGYFEAIGIINSFGSIVFLIAMGGVSWMNFWVFFFSMGFLALTAMMTILSIVREKEYRKGLKELEAQKKEFGYERQEKIIEVNKQVLDVERRKIEALKDPVIKIKNEKVTEKSEDGAVILQWDTESMYTNGDFENEIVSALSKLHEEATCQRATVPSSWKKYSRSPWQKNKILKDIGLSMSKAKATNSTAATVLKRIKRKYPGYFTSSPIVRV